MAAEREELKRLKAEVGGDCCAVSVSKNGRLRRWIRGWVATLDLMSDREALADLRAAMEQRDEDARPWSEVRKDYGL